MSKLQRHFVPGYAFGNGKKVAEQLGGSGEADYFSQLYFVGPPGKLRWFSQPPSGWFFERLLGQGTGIYGGGCRWRG
jgi:hypothetical protein